MAILLAEDLLLLLLDDDRGDLAVQGTPGAWAPEVAASELVLGGAVLAELELAGAVALRGGVAGLPWQVVLTPTAYAPGGPADDPVLRAALQRVESLPWDPEGLVTNLGDGLPLVLAGRLAERGFVHHVADGGPGSRGQVRWPAADRAREQDVRRRVLDVLIGGVAPDRWTRTLVVLLTAARLLELVVPADRMPLPEAYRRGGLLVGGSWPASAMQRAASRLAPPAAQVTDPGAVVAAPGQVTGVVPGGTSNAVAGAAAGLAGVFAVSFAAAFVASFAEGMAEGQRGQQG